MEVCGEGSYVELFPPLVFSGTARVDHELKQLPSGRRDTSLLGRMSHRTLD
jgi:hypothetical protein